VIELARDATLSRDLSAGGVFVRGCALRISEECELVVCGANRKVSVPARVVYVDEQRGAGLELIGFSTAMREQLAELAAAAAAPPPAPDDDLALQSDCHIELSGGDDEIDELGDDDLAELGDDDLAVPLANEDDDDRGTVPVRTPLLRPAMAASTPAPARTDDRRGVPAWQDDDDHRRTVPVAMAGFPGDEAVRIDDRFAASDAAAVVGDDFEPADDPVAVAAEDAAAEDDDFAAEGADPSGFFDPDDAPSMRAGDAASLSNDFSDAEFGEGEPVPMQAGDAAATMGNDFADDDAGEPPVTGPSGAEPEIEIQPEPEPEIAPAPGEPASRGVAGTRAPRNVNERLRGLNLAAQIKLATNGELHERIVLERLYGKNVWETLLRNPRLTAPEVSRIARYGALPRVLLELILANNTWLQVPEVRRALLGNPRLATEHIMKVLRLTPKHELRLAAVQTAYPHAVRNAAKQLLRE